MKTSLSIIIPTLNEADYLSRTLDSIDRSSDPEVLIADGGSQDATVYLAREMGLTIIDSLPGRARQLNRAAAAAQGDILLFLHADTRLPGGYLHHINAELQPSGVILGAFRLGIEGEGRALRLVELVANLRSSLFSAPYGDQGLFIRRETFVNLGGFREMPLMEDYELVRRARRLGRIALAKAKVVTSARRWEKLGVARTTLLNWWIILSYRAGVSPETLAAWYRR